jgi:electron transfer flavoprotein alpha/beta subunit
MNENGAAMKQNREIRDALEEAAALRHPQRAMRVTLECGHLRLMPWIGTVMGIGAQTSCAICPKSEDSYPPSRVVVNCEETGTLHESWRPGAAP